MASKKKDDRRVPPLRYTVGTGGQKRITNSVRYGQRHVMTGKQRAAVDFYFGAAKFNKAEAARLAGYKQANIVGPRIFQHPLVIQEVDRREAEARRKSGLTEQWVIERMMRIADSGATLAKFRKVLPNGKLDWDFTGATQEELSIINELTVEKTKYGAKMKVGTSDPKGALDSLMRKLGLFKDNVDVKFSNSIMDRLQRGRERMKMKGIGDAEEAPSSPDEGDER